VPFHITKNYAINPTNTNTNNFKNNFKRTNNSPIFPSDSTYLPLHVNKNAMVKTSNTNDADVTKSNFLKSIGLPNFTNDNLQMPFDVNTSDRHLRNPKLMDKIKIDGTKTLLKSTL
jgi:hypothetical protein